MVLEAYQVGLDGYRRAVAGSGQPRDLQEQALVDFFRSEGGGLPTDRAAGATRSG